MPFFEQYHTLFDKENGFLQFYSEENNGILNVSSRFTFRVKHPFIFFILVILIIFILCYFAYFCYKKFISNNDDDNNDIKDMYNLI